VHESEFIKFINKINMQLRTRCWENRWNLTLAIIVSTDSSAWT